MKKHIIISIKMLLFMTLFCGLAYTLFITGISQILFPKKANGSIIEIDGQKIGSELIGQKFTSDNYFWSRPSATDYNPLPSAGSNLSMISEKLKDTSMILKDYFISRNKQSTNTDIPNEMIFSSASGLDPHISVEAAKLQVKRIAMERNINETQLINLIDRIKENRQFLVLGEERINVLLINLELDKLSKLK
jgi:potassium-transporting ATPase KdpC subunit